LTPKVAPKKKSTGLPSGSSGNGVSGRTKRRKTFLTTFMLLDGEYCWEIKAYDFEEAEKICRLINHKLVGKEVKV
jgi:hypothetical protein